MSTLNIGFLGGCINNQKGIAKEDFYYEVFSRMMQDTPHCLATGIYISFDTMVTKAGSFIEKNVLDVLFLVIRQFPLMPLHKPLVKYENKQGKISWAVHPALIHRKLKWNPGMTQYYTLNEYVHKEKSRFGWRDMNLLAGMALGLYRWGPEYVLQEVQKVSDLCAQKNIQLIVLSTQQYPTSVMGDIACKKISNKLEKWLKASEIHYVNIIDLGPPGYFADDLVHFSADCHRLIAEKLFEKLMVIKF